MKRTEKGLTSTQAIITVASMMIGVRLLTVPRDVTAATGTPDGWISSLLDLALGVIAVAVAALVARMFVRQGFFEFTQLIIGKIPGYLLTTGYAAYLVFFVANETRVLGEVVRYYLLSDTPLEIIVLLVLMPVIYLLYGGMTSVVRIQEIFFPVIMTVILLLMALLYSAVELKKIEPIMGQGMLPVLKGLPITVLAALGFEMIMIFGPLMKNPREGLKAGITSIVIVKGMNTLIILLGIAAFGHLTLPSVVFPVTEMAKEIEIPGGFVERLDSAFLTVWIMSIFSTIAIGLFVASYGIEKLYRVKIRTAVLILTPLVVWIALTPENLQDAFAMGKTIVNVGIFYIGTVPAVLFLIAKLRNLGESGKNRFPAEASSEEAA
ncbi:GerAB/ArcD/ProY family transporter [Effusibacillus consociatus]|uniref:GerAB/ArcD/ProY family transporter n=1 Tax=Effusibacillus consociatus TaxID=1117041 RepID=A0ABV9Q8I3_9BACL